MKRKSVLWILLTLLAINVLILAVDIQPVKASSVVGWWKFDEGSGTTTLDSSGNGNDGTIYGATWIAGKYGNALQFDGVDDYVEVPYSSILDISGTIEISAWIKGGVQNAPPGELKIKEIVEKGDDLYIPNAGYALRISDYASIDPPNAGPNEAGHANFDLNLANYPNWPDDSFHINSVSRVDDNNWHFIDATYDGNLMKMYVDSVLETTFTVSSPIYTNHLTLRIGSGHGSRFFNGTIDEVKIYGSSPPPSPRAPSVGGFFVSIDKFGLMAPYIGLASTTMIGAVATVVYVRRVKRRKEKQ